MNLFAFVSNPSVVCRLVSEPSGTISFSLSKQLRKWALLLTEGDGKTMHKYQDGKFVDRLKLHKRCCCCWVRRQNCIFRAQNKHSSGSCRCVSGWTSVYRPGECFEEWRKLQIELFIDNWIASCRWSDGSVSMSCMLRGDLHNNFQSIISQALWNWNVCSLLWSWRCSEHI